MIPHTLKETWSVVKTKLKERYAELTDNDLAYILGREEETLGHIQEKTGASREDILRILRDECGCDY